MEYNVSVIIPMYNRAHTIRRTLDSVLRQTLSGIEIIVVDDGSTDGGAEVVRQYQREHDQIVLFCTENHGPGQARNFGLQQAHGKYFIFLDSDDTVPERAYELLFHAAEEGTCDFVIGQMARSISNYKNGEWFLLPQITPLIRQYEGKNCADKYELAAKNPSSVNKLVNRKFALKNQICFPAGRLAEDSVYTIRLYLTASKVAAIDEIVYLYKTDISAQKSLITKPSADVIIEGIRNIESYCLVFDRMQRIDVE